MNSQSDWLAKYEVLESKAATAAAVSYRSLGIARILFGCFFFLFLWERFAWLGAVPDAFFNPPPLSVAALFQDFPSVGFFKVMDAIIIVSALATTLGWRTRWSTAIWLLASITCLSFKYSFGKIDHSIMLYATLFTMIWVDWGKCMSIDEFLQQRKKGIVEPDRSCSLNLLTLLLAVGFFSAGFPKAIAWIDFDATTGGFLSWLYNGYHTLGRTRLLADFAIHLRPLWIWEFADYAAVVFELGWIVARFNGFSLRGWLVIAAVFHLMNILLLNIAFIIHIPVYLCFVDWNRHFPVKWNWMHRHLAALLLVLTVIILLVVGLTLQTSRPEPFANLVFSFGISNLLVAMVLFSGTLIFLLRELSEYQNDRVLRAAKSAAAC